MALPHCQARRLRRVKVRGNLPVVFPASFSEVLLCGLWFPQPLVAASAKMIARRLPRASCHRNSA